MLSCSKIICPTDFSEPSTHALKVAGELAIHFSAELVIVYSVDPMPTFAAPAGMTAFPVAGSDMGSAPFDVEAYQRELRKTAADALEHLQKEHMPPDLGARRVVLVGQPATEIVRFAEEEKADVIIIATHGRTGWRRFVFGSVAEKVVRHAPCAVVTIPPPREKREE